MALPQWADKVNKETNTRVQDFVHGRQTWIRLEKKLEKAQEKRQRIARKARLEMERPQWYNVGARYRRDQALRRLRQSRNRIRQLRREARSAWEDQRRRADRLRRRRLNKEGDKKELSTQELDLLRVHDRDRLAHLEKAFKKGLGSLESIKRERSYYRALKRGQQGSEEIKAALARLKGMRRLAGLDG